MKKQKGVLFMKHHGIICQSESECINWCCYNVQF